jgi:hypothetical protein
MWCNQQTITKLTLQTFIDEKCFLTIFVFPFVHCIKKYKNEYIYLNQDILFSESFKEINWFELTENDIQLIIKNLCEVGLNQSTNNIIRPTLILVTQNLLSLLKYICIKYNIIIGRVVNFCKNKQTIPNNFINIFHKINLPDEIYSNIMSFYYTKYSYIDELELIIYNYIGFSNEKLQFYDLVLSKKRYNLKGLYGLVQNNINIKKLYLSRQTSSRINISNTSLYSL